MLKLLIFLIFTVTVISADDKCFDDWKGTTFTISGDYATDLGGKDNWLANEPLGLMKFNKQTCNYILILQGLTPNKEYNYKIVLNNNWDSNLGCGNGNCVFKTSSKGDVRIVFVPRFKNSPFFFFDYNVEPFINNDDTTDNDPQLPSTTTSINDDDTTTISINDDATTTDDHFTTNNDIITSTNSPSDSGDDVWKELPNCDRFDLESCRSGSQIAANPEVAARRWQTPKPGTSRYLKSFQDYHTLVGFGDIRYTSPQRNEADVCIIATKRDSATLTYLFNGIEQSDNCKRFDSSHEGQVKLNVIASDGAKLEIPPLDLIWNQQQLGSRPNGDYRNGQKGSVVEFFGWKHSDVEKECEILGKAGYLGAKLFPVHEQLMSHQPMENVMNPWYFMYQPVSYKLDGRGGTREELTSLINTCRRRGVRVYVDAVLNHMTGAGNDLNNHRNPNAGCTKWGNKTSSAPIDRQSSFYTHAFTYEYNPNTNDAPANEFAGSAFGPEDFHCERPCNAWSDLFILNNGWLVGLTDLDTSRDYVRERQAAYLVELMSMGVSGFRIDAAKHMSPEDLAAIFGKVQQKMGGQLPDDFFAWLEVLTGGEAQQIWREPGWYGFDFENKLLESLGSMSEVDKIKMWDGLYPKEAYHNPISKHRVVIQNDDHDQQHPGSSSRDMAGDGCVLVKDCDANTHRNFEMRLFNNPNGVGNNDNDWPIRFILSSYYHTYGHSAIPDGLSNCDMCTTTCDSCREGSTYKPAYVPGQCGYNGVYTKVHRDVQIINAMRGWMKLNPISGGDIGLDGC